MNISTSRAGAVIVVGTRGSPLALGQTRWVIARLAELYPQFTFQLQKVRTQGDLMRTAPLLQIGGKGVFVKEIEDALLAGRIDLAVHSLKDLPTAQPAGLSIAAVCPREDPRDVLICPAGDGLDDLPTGTVVGTGSLRRRAQLLARRPDLTVCEIRGNVDTRLRKVERGEYGATVLAAAGMRRLGYEVQEGQYLPLEVMLPAVGQGALAVEVRQGDERIAALVRRLNDAAAETATRAERALLAAFGGGCAVPIAAHARVEDGRVHLQGLVASPDGRRLVRGEVSGPAQEAERLGQALARQLMARGADEIIREVLVER